MVPQWLFLWLLWNLVSDAYVTAVGSILQDVLMPGTSPLGVLENAIKSVVLAPFVNLVQAGVLCSCLFQPAKGFDVIVKH